MSSRKMGLRHRRRHWQSCSINFTLRCFVESQIHQLSRRWTREQALSPSCAKPVAERTSNCRCSGFMHPWGSPKGSQSQALRCRSSVCGCIQAPNTLHLLSEPLVPNKGPWHATQVLAWRRALANNCYKGRHSTGLRGRLAQSEATFNLRVLQSQTPSTFGLQMLCWHSTNLQLGCWKWCRCCFECAFARLGD